MSTDKILNKIHALVNELAPTLELFVDENVQPSVKDCELLQKHLSALQEIIAVYKYDKQNKELSPSFNIHAKVSEKEVQEEQKLETPAQTKAETKMNQEKPEPKVNREYSRTEPIKQRRSLIVGINDKFRFINELFFQNSSEYNIAIEQLNNLSNWSDTEIYLNSLKNVYGWKENTEVVKYFYSLVRKCFE
jgi:hypothetical protein